MDAIGVVAVIVLCSSYLAQIYKIHQHKEVRDLSLPGFFGLALAYVILGYEAYLIGSKLFLIKNFITLSLVGIIIAQIYYHYGDEWHDDDDLICDCTNELEDNWNYCPDCGEQVVRASGDAQNSGSSTHCI